MKGISYYFPLVLFSLASCGTNFKNGALQAQIKIASLEQEIYDLKSNTQNLILQPIVIPKSSTINLGEEFYADIRIAIVDTINLPIVINCLWDSVNKSLTPTGDTLIYDKDSRASIFRVRPKTRGDHYFAGILYYQFMSKNYKSGFMTKVNVK